MLVFVIVVCFCFVVLLKEKHTCFWSHFNSEIIFSISLRTEKKEIERHRDWQNRRINENELRKERRKEERQTDVRTETK